MTHNVIPASFKPEPKTERRFEICLDSGCKPAGTTESVDGWQLFGPLSTLTVNCTRRRPKPAVVKDMQLY